MKKQFWIRRVALFVVLVPLFVALAGGVVMWLWNWLMPDLFGLKTISFLQALGLFALAKILLGGFGGGRGGRYGGGYRRHRWKALMEERMAGMTEEQKAEFRKNWQKGCE